jgi:L-seryl-tRNA(Ser) seleniumtransferase
LRAALAPGLNAEVAPSTAQVGGGSLPGEALPSWSLVIGGARGDPDTLAARLRAGEPAVVGRIGGGRLILDLFTVADEEIELVAHRLNAAVAP